MFKNKRNFTKNKFFIDNSKFVCYIDKKYIDEVKAMNTYLLKKQDMNQMWLAQYDYDTCRLIPLYSFLDR